MPVMNPTLFFLRSSEQKIVTDMLRYAWRLDETGTPLTDDSPLRLFDRYYGLTRRDLGVYALSGHEVAGAAWVRLFSEEAGAPGYVDDATPVLTVAVKPPFRGSGIGRALMEQLLLEAGALYGAVSVAADVSSRGFFERFGFLPAEGSESVMITQLERADVPNVSEGYDPTYWMD